MFKEGEGEVGADGNALYPQGATARRIGRKEVREARGVPLYCAAIRLLKELVLIDKG